jgi:hypothetical protein
MPVSDVPGIVPEGAVDVSDEVNEIVDQITDAFHGHSFEVVGLAIGAAIGGVFNDPDVLKQFLTGMCETAATVFAMNLSEQAAGSTIN